jgi:S-adenosylmethionine:tRNA ribosyltransferase-isomerase
MKKKSLYNFFKLEGLFFNLQLLIFAANMKHPATINIEDYNYDLPQERIAKFPLDKRDQSKLLIYENGKIYKNVFKNIDKNLPPNSLLVFNETKVIQARLHFFKENGAKIEIFCLEAVSPTAEVQLAFQQNSPVIWKCFVGNSKKWKEGSLKKRIEIKGDEIDLFATRKAIEGEAYLIEFSWLPSKYKFSQILESAGLVPLPPYMNREAAKEDKNRYQTIYACQEGSVAAPTAGLHFTKNIFTKLKKKNIQIDELTLHVGAGTFKPVSTSNIGEHEMHTEKILLQKSCIENLIRYTNKNIIAVGTTTVRTLESLYWFACKLVIEENPIFNIKQWDPYLDKYQLDKTSEELLSIVLNYMENKGIEVLQGKTQLMIVPSYQFKLINILITNFHQPKSTLLLLVSAFIGDDWKKAYQFAFENDFRFLSYGDSCLFKRVTM